MSFLLILETFFSIGFKNLRIKHHKKHLLSFKFLIITKFFLLKNILGILLISDAAHDENRLHSDSFINKRVFCIIFI